MSRKRSTLRDVAQKAGVTVSTVSRLLNNKPLTVPVTDSTRQRVLEAAKSLEYTPNQLARGLAAAKTYILGMSFPITSPLNRVDHRDVTYINLGMLISGVQNVLQARGYELHIFNRIEHKQHPDAPIRRMNYDFIDGLIYVEPNPCYPYYEDVAEAGLPMVMLGQTRMRHTIHTVCAEDRAEMRQLVASLLRKGHRRIAYVLSVMNEPPMDVIERMEGYSLAHKDAEIPVDPLLLRRERASDVPLAATLNALLALRPAVDALIIGRTEIGEDSLKHLLASGVRVPEDMEVIVVGDDRFFEATRPRLSAMRLGYLERGMAAAQLLLDAVEGRANEAAHTPVHWKFIERDSCVLRDGFLRGPVDGSVGGGEQDCLPPQQAEGPQG